MKTLGIIDIGSNSIKLIIVEINKNSYKEIFHKKFQTRLSQYMEKESKNLCEEGIKKFFNIIYTFKRACDNYNCDEIIAVATETFRQLSNSNEIIDDILSKLDVKIKILSADEECYFGYFSSIPKDLYDYVHIDMGGGSVEIGLVKNRNLVESVSIPMGAFKMTKKFHIDNNISHEDEVHIQEYVYNKLNNIEWIDKCKNLPAVAIGGSIKTIGRLHQQQQNVTSNIHGYKLFSHDLEFLIHKITPLSLDEITSTTGLSKTRGDILLGALLTLNSIISYLQSPKIIISKYTIREGILNYYMKNNS